MKLLILMKIRRTFSFSWFICFCLCSGAILLAVGLYELTWIRADSEFNSIHQAIEENHKTNPVYVVYGHDVESGYLKHVFEMFDAFGFVRGSLDSDNWTVLWAHDYPFRVLKDKLKLTKLEKHQKVNHFPGTGFITNKLDLAKTDSAYIPKAFEMPKQKEALLKYVSRNPKKMFVQKSNDHRGIQIEKIQDLNLNKEGIFIQEFVDNPLLVDGHKFDIGVYTIITSVEPLRVYIYNGDILFRFCPEKYHPFDQKNKNKYVIGDDYLPLWEVPSLKRYFSAGGYSMKVSFDSYMHSLNRNPEPMWEKIEDAIRNIVLLKEASIIRVLQNYRSKRNFFEMIRFDFAVDNDLNVFIMEANMSPNLSSAHFPPNRLIYYQVLFNLFSLIGFTNYKRSLKDNMDVSLKNLMVFPEICSSQKCASCFSSECQICLNCLSQESIEYLKDSYVEHNNRQDCKRVVPPSITTVNTVNDSVNNLSPDNLLLWTWFKGKCALDRSWC